jgi:hypothetical protein
VSDKLNEWILLFFRVLIPGALPEFLASTSGKEKSISESPAFHTTFHG